MKREVCFLITRTGALVYADFSDNATALPDSRLRWQMIWKLRDQLDEIAHSHPLGGLFFSAEDLSTMQAVDSALGRTLAYAVVTPQGIIARRGERVFTPHLEPWWTGLMRSASGMSIRYIDNKGA